MNFYIKGGETLMDFDTITSISTPMGEGAIGIVRLSGPQAIEIGDILYKGKKSYLKLRRIQ